MNPELLTRKFEFNAVYIFESLCEGEKQSGSELYNDVVRWKGMRLKYLDSFLITVAGKQELFAELEKIKQSVPTGKIFPFLHFEIHGNVNGLVLSSGELINWKELVEKLREINIILKNNLFVSLATCYGAYILSEAKPSLPSPFFGLIGPWKKIEEGDLMQSFQTFFDFILDDKDPQHIDFNKAVEILNESNELPRRYHFYNSEYLFEHIYDDYDKSLWVPGGMSRRVNGLMNELYKSLGSRKPGKSKSQLRREIEEKLIRDRHKIKEDIKQNFLMMVDHQPN